MRKIVMGYCILLCLITIITASLNSYFGRIDTELKIEQAITIDGKPVHQPITNKLRLLSGASVEVSHKIINNGDIDVNISQYSTGLIEGIELIISWKNGTVVTFPFILEGGNKVTLTFTYSTNVNIVEDIYLVQTYFSCMEI